MKKNYEMDMCSGPILGKLLTFTIPLIFSGILQLLFNAADVIVVGRFAGSQSLAAVGSTTALINLMINIFIGLSVGVNVIVARYYGAKREKRRAGYDPHGHGTQHRQRSFSDHCGSASLEANAGTHGNSGRCDR